MASCYTGFELTPPTRHPPAPHKDYSRPLHVDCSVEYELPNQAKPPEGSHLEPLLMIHPCYYRRAESQRRSPFINNLPATRSSQSATLASSSRRTHAARPTNQQIQPPQQPIQPQPTQHQPIQQHQYSLRYLDPSMVPHQQISQQQQQQPPPQQMLQQHHQLPQTQTLVAWGQMDPSIYTTKTSKKDPLMCGGEFSSGSDSGVSLSAGQWTDSDRSPLAPEIRLQRDFQAGTDSGITTPVDDKAILSELLAATCGEVNNNQNSVAKDVLPLPVAGGQHKMQQQQPAVGVAAVAASCSSCRPSFVPPHAPAYQRVVQQPWTGVTALPSGGRPRGARAVEPGPEHAAASLHAHTRRAVPWSSRTGGSAAKRSRTSHAQDAATAAAAAANQWAAAAAATQYLPSSADVARTGWPAATHVPQPCDGGKDCAAAAAVAPVCKVCIQSNGSNTKVETASQPWSSYYGVGHCRGASEDMSSRVLWNNENMLRLFQV